MIYLCRSRVESVDSARLAGFQGLSSPRVCPGVEQGDLHRAPGGPVPVRAEGAAVRHPRLCAAVSGRPSSTTLLTSWFPYDLTLGVL